MKTYDQARREILQALRAAGWQVNDSLKVPHATSPDRQLRLWFKKQAVYHTKGTHHAFGDARTISYDLDIRKLDGPIFMRLLGRWFGSAYLPSAQPARPRGRYEVSSDSCACSCHSEGGQPCGRCCGEPN